MKNLSWSVEPGTMHIKIKDSGVEVMRIFIGEAIELAGRKNVMEHVDACDHSPWLKDWQRDRLEAESDKIVDKLARKV